VQREAVIAGLASEGLALILGSAEAGSSSVVGPMPTDPVEFRKCARDSKALSAAKEHTNEERGGGRDPGVTRMAQVWPGLGQLPWAPFFCERWNPQEARQPSAVTKFVPNILRDAKISFGKDQCKNPRF